MILLNKFGKTMVINIPCLNASPRIKIRYCSLLCMSFFITVGGNDGFATKLSVIGNTFRIPAVVEKGVER
jgi:hypothetical protein